MDVFRNARYERRIQALEARVAELVQAINGIGPMTIEASAKVNALFNIWTAQAEMLPGEERPTTRVELVN